MGINKYLVDSEKREFIHLGTGIKHDIDDLFYSLRDKTLLPDYVKECVKNWKWSSVSQAYINLIADKISEFVIKSGDNLVLVSDDIYMDLHGEYGLTDENENLTEFYRKFTCLFDVWILGKWIGK